jgi:hypothetical protein
MRITWRSGLPALGMASALLLAACGSSTDENSGSIGNPQGLSADVTGLVGTLTAGPLIGVNNVGGLAGNALSQLSRGHGGIIAAAIGARPSLVVKGHGFIKMPMVQGGTVRPRPMGSDGRILTMGDAIDDSYYGTVFAYNPQTGEYEDDLSGAGPANGVRFIVYDADPQTGQIDPNTPLGTLDVLDQSTVSLSEVGIEVKDLNGTTTFADYQVTLPDTYDPQTGAFDLTSGGTLSNGTDNLNFSLHQSQNSFDDASVTVGLDGPNASLDFIFDSSDDPQTDDGHLGLDINLHGGGETLRLSGTQDYDATSDTYATDFTIRANGGVFATATTDNGGDPIFEKPNGDPLTSDEMDLLDAIGGGVFTAVLDVYALVFFALLMVS